MLIELVELKRVERVARDDKADVGIDMQELIHEQPHL